MNLFWIYLISTINVLTISVSLTFFLVKGYQHILLDLEQRRALGESNSETAQVINSQLSLLLKNFSTSFVVLEVSLIFYFIFWDVLFYLSLNK